MGSSFSALTLSGPFVLVAKPLFTAPTAVFLGTCLTSIIFAVLAAQPRFVNSKSTLAQFQRDQSNILDNRASSGKLEDCREFQSQPRATIELQWGNNDWLRA